MARLNPRRQRQTVRPSRRVILLTVVSIVCGAVLVGVALVGIQRPQDNVVELNHRILPAGLALGQTADGSAASHRLLLTALRSAPEQRPVIIADAQDAGNRANTAWRQYLRHAFGSAAELRLQSQYSRSVRDGQAAGATVYGLIDSPDNDAYDAALALEQQASDHTLAILSKINTQFYDSPRIADLQDTEDSLASAGSSILIAFGIVLVLGLLIALALLRSAFRDERLTDARAEEHQYEQHRSDLENQLQRGLEMEPSEEATYTVIAGALRLVRPGEPVEVLVADSSRSHFHQVLSTDPAGRAGCSVTSPGDCPAASGQTRLFPSSTRLDACPYLRSREGGPMSAACVPISIAGTNTGIIHTTGPDQQTPAASQMTELELVARKAGDRIGFLRVLALTETQAHVDVLTGLFNRRSVEHQADEVLNQGAPFVVAFADLDHFKDVNDKHGHETGDRALRLFGRVLRDSVRPADIPARYGGEEFVVLLPDCALADAHIVANRIRSRLASALSAATVPAFTVSIGLAAWEPPEGFSDTVARADATLLQAKGEGRDRVMSSVELPDTNGAGTKPPAPGTNGPAVVARSPDVSPTGR